MSRATAVYYDGKRALRASVELVLEGAKIKLAGEGCAAEFDARAIRVSPRIARTPRWLYLPDGGACAVADNRFAERLTRRNAFTGLLHELESHPAYAVFAVAYVVFMVWLLMDRGLPIAAERIAQQIPIGAETVLGQESLAGMDRYFMKPSALPAARQAALKQSFAQMAHAGDAAGYRIEFRSSPVIGPNAFALPSGIIVMTDELVNVARNDAEILGVLAHELGHVHYRHTMRQLLESSATALLIAALTGDIASTTSLAAAAPAVLLQSKYSRDNEREADRYAVDLLQRSGLDPRYFATILQRIERQAGEDSSVPGFLSSHPPTQERRALADRIAGPGAAELFEEGVRASAVTDAARDPPPVAVADPDQQKLLGLLEQRNFNELENVLGTHQLQFERDASASVSVAQAFGTFRKARNSLAPALDEWVLKKPDSYAAHVARGSYYVARGLDARGSDTYANTPPDKIDAMQAHLQRAREDLERSLSLTRKPYVSHRMLLTIAKTLGNRNAQREHYEGAIQFAPASVETRLAYLSTLEPRWGGSYEQMEAFVSKSRTALRDPRDFARLAAQIPAYRGFEKQRDQDFQGALAYFNEAIALDSAADTLCQRSYVLSRLKRPADAFRDVSLALSKERDDRYCLEMAVYLAPQTGEANEVIRLMTLVIDADPASAGALNQRAWRHFSLDQHELAFADYLASAKLGDAFGQLQVGKLYWRGVGIKADRDEALVWLRKAAAQGHPDATLSLQQALAASGDKHP